MCLVSEIMGMAISRPMTSPLFNNRMRYLWRSDMCCRCDWYWEWKWGPWTLPWHVLQLQFSMPRQDFRESADPPHLSPNSQSDRSL